MCFCVPPGAPEELRLQPHMLHTPHACVASCCQMKREKRMPHQRMAYALLLIVFLSIFVALLSPHPARAQETPTVRTPPPQQIEPPASAPDTSNNNEVDRYTLSHDRYEKAVAYSRAGYSLYFLSVFIGFVVSFGVALRLRCSHPGFCPANHGKSASAGTHFYPGAGAGS